MTSDTQASAGYRESVTPSVFDKLFFELRRLMDKGFSAGELAERIGPELDRISDDKRRQAILKHVSTKELPQKCFAIPALEKRGRTQQQKKFNAK